MSVSIIEHLSHSPATSKELQRATGLSQPVVSRQLTSMGDRLIRLREGRVIRYYLTQNAFGADDKLSLYMVDSHGNNVIVAHIRPLAQGGFFVEPCTGMPPVLLGENGNGLYDDLPYFLDDLRPQGFLGRQIAGVMAEISPNFPTDPRHWSVNHIGRYLISNGDDLPGNFKFGEQTYLRVRRCPEAISHMDYPSLAEAVIRGVLPGSPAGGEQPKFTAYNVDRGHVIVKFSPLKEDAVARRWRDIIITEYHAIKTLHTWNFPAAKTRLFDLDGRLFLESQRFDRSGEFGRMPLISLLAVDNEFTGLGSNWPAVMNGLRRLNLVSLQHVYGAEFLWCFGRLINNTDMHLSNLSLSFEGNVFRILPAYDMCSMGFAPKSGEVPPFVFTPPTIGVEVNLSTNMLDRVKNMAKQFWDDVTGDERISDEFREFLSHSNPVDQQNT